MMINFYHYSNSKVKIERGKKKLPTQLCFFLSSFGFMSHTSADSTEALKQSTSDSLLSCYWTIIAWRMKMKTLERSLGSAAESDMLP